MKYVHERKGGRLKNEHEKVMLVTLIIVVEVGKG